MKLLSLAFLKKLDKLDCTVDIIKNDKSEGASTITQQYARNLFLNFEKTWKRKIDEPEEDIKRLIELDNELIKAFEDE